jgi:hypothetical protein
MRGADTYLLKIILKNNHRENIQTVVFTNILPYRLFYISFELRECQFPPVLFMSHLTTLISLPVHPKLINFKEQSPKSKQEIELDRFLMFLQPL